MSYTFQIIEPVRIDIGKMLIAHEMDKLFPGLGNYDDIKAIVNNRWNDLDGEVAIRNFWNLVDSLMMGYELKDIVRLITSEKSSWRLEKDNEVKELRFGWGEKIGDLELNQKTAGEAADYLAKHEDVLEDIKKKNIKNSPRVNDPIIVEKDPNNGKLHVHDGNGRLLRAIIKRQQSIDAYIGTQASVRKSNHWVTTSYLQRLADLRVKDYFKSRDLLVHTLRESENAVFEFKSRVTADFKQEVLSAI